MVQPGRNTAQIIIDYACRRNGFRIRPFYFVQVDFLVLKVCLLLCLILIII